MHPDAMGHPIGEATLKKGLQELNPDISFDWGAALGLDHPCIADRQGVFYKNMHICSMDRGKKETSLMVPEFASWYQKRKLVSVPLSSIYRDEPFVFDILNMKNVKVWRMVPYRCRWIGWRALFEELLRNKVKIPGVTRASLARKFSVTEKFWNREQTPEKRLLA